LVGAPVGGELVIVARNRSLKQSCSWTQASLPCTAMKEPLTRLFHLLTTIAKLLRPGAVE